MTARNTKLGAAIKEKINDLGAIQGVPILGNELEVPKNLKQSNIDQTYTNENFNGIQKWGLKGGGAAVGTTGANNQFVTELGNIFDSFVLGAGQTTFVHPKTANGLDVTGDGTDNEGFEIWQGNETYAKHAYTAQTDRFYFQAKIKSSVVGSYDECMFGLRKVEAGQAAIGTYTDYVAVNVDNGDIDFDYAVGGADLNVDTTDDLANTQYLIVRMEYDDRVALTRAIALANEMKAAYTAHIADITMHTTAADATNVITADDATTLATLKTLIGDMLTQYDAHEGDSELGAAWLYHPAQETGDDSLASAVAPTTLAECCTRLNDLRTKFSQHEVDATSHAIITGLHLPSIHTAGALTVTYGINTTTLSAPTVYPAYTFTDALVVIPFFRQLHDATAAGTLELCSWEVGPIA
jgi:hypothetical protein